MEISCLAVPSPAGTCWSACAPPDYRSFPACITKRVWTRTTVRFSRLPRNTRPPVPPRSTPGMARSALSGGQILGHQRMLSANNGKAVHSTYAASYAINSTGADDSNNLQHYFFGAGGAIRIGLGNNPLLGISVALAAPALKNSGVFLDPTRITNAASSAPFTAGIAPGELITLYGTNLAAAAQYDPTLDRKSTRL